MVMESLCKFENVIPPTELCVMLHVLLHVPDMVYKWNSMRNYWSFFGERTMGYFIRFIHNRDLAAENIVTAYTRFRYLLHAASAAGRIESLHAKISKTGLELPRRSMLQQATKVYYISLRVYSCLCRHLSTYVGIFCFVPTFSDSVLLNLKSTSTIRLRLLKNVVPCRESTTWM